MAQNPFLSNLVQAWGGKLTSIPAFRSKDWPDETLSPAMSDFIRTARRYLIGQVDSDDFIDAIQEILENLAGYLQLHRQLFPGLSLELTQQALGFLAGQAVVQFTEGISAIVSCFSQSDFERVEQAIEHCKQAILVLEAWWIELARIVRQQVGRICQECGRVSAWGEEQCPHCQEDFPRLDQEVSVNHDYLEVFEFWLELYRQTQAMLAGQLARSEWGQKLMQVRNELIRLRSRLGLIPAWEKRRLQVAPALLAAQVSLDSALGDVVLALDDLRSTRQQEEMNTAWFQLLKGLQQVQRLAPELAQELQDLQEELEAELPAESKGS